MKTRKLNLNLAGVITLFYSWLVLAACNNSSKSENSSTSDKSDTTITKDTTPANTTNIKTGKRVGRATTTIAKVDKSATMKTDDQGYYNYTETAPAFPGGQSSLEDYISTHIQYPDEAINNEIEGTVYVLFTIDENGKVANVKTTGNAIGYGLEEEAIRVVSSMSNWTPGTNKGKNVKAWYTLPITYKLES